MVGTNQGVVHNQKQGTGLATILPTPNTDQFQLIAREKRALNEGLAKEKRAEAAAALKGITDFNPERWFKHEATIQPMMNEWMSQGAKMMATGENPWRSVKPEAIEWRKKKMEIEGIANASAQTKDMYIATKNKVDGAEPDKYDAASIQALVNHFDKDVVDIAKDGIVPPPLMQRTPFANLQKTWSETMGEINSRREDVPLNDNDRWKIVRETLSNPAIGEKLAEATTSAMAQLTANERTNLEGRAKQLGRPAHEVMSYDLVKRYEVMPEPFDFNKWINAGAKSFEVPYTDWKGADSFSRRPDKKELETIARTQAENMLTADIEALEGYKEILPMKTGELDGSYKARAIPDLTKRLIQMKATETASGVTASGQGKQDQIDSGRQWIKDMLSKDPAAYGEAANFLFTTTNIIPGMVVTNTNVRPSTAGYDELWIELDGRPTVEKMKETALEAGLPVDKIEMEQVGAKSTMKIPITIDTENALLRLHDQAFNETKVAYKGKGVTAKPTLSTLGGGDTKKAPASKAKY